MIEIVPYNPQHLLSAGVNPGDYMLDYECMAAYTALADGVPVACGGVRPPSCGICEAWFIPLPGFESRYVRVCSIIRREVLPKLRGLPGVRCIAATYDADNYTHARFAGWLGFTELLGVYHGLSGANAGRVLMVVALK